MCSNVSTKILTKLVLMIILLVQYAYSLKYWKHPDADLTIEQQIAKDGYEFEVHEIETEDNYILKAIRVFHGKNQSTTMLNRSVVVLAHGLSASLNYYFTLGPKRAVAYHLADQGFDVWAFNARGTLPGKHRYFDWNTNKAYWQFSWHHIGVYDIPAVIDYALNVTGQKQVFFIGHSAGNTAFFVMASERPEYNDKIKVAASYGPSVFLENVEYPIITIASHLYPIVKRLLVDILDLPVLLPHIEELSVYAKEFCAYRRVYKGCAQIANLIGGAVSKLFDENLITSILNEFPQRVATMEVLHYMQQVYNGGFSQFDYGKIENMKIYGQKKPPAYHLGNCTAAVAFMWSSYDIIATYEDLQISKTKLSNVVFDYQVPFNKFTHTDYLFAYNATELVYEPTSRLFQDYDQGKVYDKRKLP